jgi:hypothetical protein
MNVKNLRGRQRLVETKANNYQENNDAELLL